LSEKFLKKLIGKTDIEDALKRLDKLTNEEVRMVAAQVLEATHIVHDRVRVVESKVLDKVAGVDERVASVDGRVANIGETVAGVNDRLAHVDERVTVVDDRVAGLDDKVAVVIDGAQPSLISQQPSICIFNSVVPRRKGGKASHSTSRRRHGSSEKFVIFILH
jgi:hypothetical protein